jgi:BirA family biotin operon repressor/biotin-[acetyl-CoA-carboxylase] ligase
MNAEQLRGSTFVRHIELHEELGSSNDRALELACVDDVDLPALIVARHQSAGRGRGTNKWWSADGALTFSLLLDPTQLGISTAKWPRLSLATAVAVCDALAEQARWALPTTGDELPNEEELVSSAHPTRRTSPQAARLGIKWPNDVMLDGAKVCGILIESPGGAAPAKDRLVIGIGINVNNSCREGMQDSGPNRIALRDVSRQKHNLQDILEAVLRAICVRLGQIGRNDSRLAKSWQDKCWLTEQCVEVQSGSTWIEGICLGIDTDGALLIENVFGVHRVRSGSVRTR